MNIRKLIKIRAQNRRTVKMERRQWLLGTMVTVVVALVWWAGWLDRVEFQTQDARGNRFYSRTETPSDKIVLAAIDDGALDRVGRWPWDREKIAKMIAELRRAQANTVAIDVLFNEPAPIRYVERPDPATWEIDGGARRQPDETSKILRKVDDDYLLNQEIYAHGRVVLASKFKFQVEERATAEDVGELQIDSVFKMLADNTEVQAACKRMEETPAQWKTSRDPAEVKAFNDTETAAVNTLLNALGSTKDVVISKGKEAEEAKLALDRALAITTAWQTSAVPELVAGRAWPRSIEPTPPVSVLASAAARLANVTFNTTDSDGVTRKIPLWVRHRSHLWPILGLAAVMEFRGVGPMDIEIRDNVAKLSYPGGRFFNLDMLRSRLSRQQEVDGLGYITWPRGLIGVVDDGEAAVARARDKFRELPDELELVLKRPAAAIEGWEWQLFDAENGRMQILSAGLLYEPALQMKRIDENLREVARLIEETMCRDLLAFLTAEERDRCRVLIRDLLQLHDDEKANTLPMETDDPAWLAALDEYKAIARKAAKEARDFLESNAGVLTQEQLKAIPDLRPDDLAMLQAALSGYEGVTKCLKEVDDSVTATATVRRQLMNLLRQRIVFIGFTAGATDSDVVNTPISSKTPGVMVHVAIANAVLQEVDRAPWALKPDFFMIGMMGLIGTWLGVRFNVFAGPIALGTLILAWFVIAGAIIWDRQLTIAAVAGPSVAAAGAWVSVLLHRLLVEQRGRKVTEERFKSYVSPAVVDILVNNPELGTMRPSMRDMTVMFTDVADFTTTSERLGPELLAKCLSKYLKEMTEILQKNRGTLDKYLGDGIMAFYNAPIDDAEHARHACITAVNMLARLDELNETGAFEEAGRLKVRIGICTGPCMVGDFGNPPRNSNYTLLGDTANFAARLEGANKFFGSRILATQRTRDQAGPDIRWRTIGKVFVKGKKEADNLFELVGRLEPHGPATEEWLQLTDEAVRHYQKREFDECLRDFDILARRFGDVKLAEIYADAIALWKSRPDFESAFDGAIVLTEK